MTKPVVLKTSAMRFPFISWSNFELEWRLGLTFTSRRITEPVRSSIISNPNSSKQFPWEAQCLWTCCTMWPSAAINVFRTTSKNWLFLSENQETQYRRCRKYRSVPLYFESKSGTFYIFPYFGCIISLFLQFSPKYFHTPFVTLSGSRVLVRLKLFRFFINWVIRQMHETIASWKWKFFGRKTD